MCGFAGFFPSISEEKDKNFINIMLKRILYRGPDNSSFYRNNNIIFQEESVTRISENVFKNTFGMSPNGDIEKTPET